MGHRANLVLVQNHQHRLYYGHWCGISIPEDFFWGPEYAVPFIERQRLEESGFWLDEVWAEGGVVQDTDHRMLLLWGGDEILRDVPLRRVYLELLQQVWAGWTVHWAYNGVFDMVDYLELPHDLVTQKIEIDEELFERPAVFARPNENSYGFSIGSIRFEDGTLRFYPLDKEIDWRLEKGPELLKKAGRARGLPALSAGEWGERFPCGGFHIDVKEKRLGFWANHAPGLAMAIIPEWLEWQVEWWRDEFEFHLEQTGGALTMAVPTAEAARARLEEKFFDARRWNMPDLLLKLAGHEMLEGADVQISEDALKQDTPEVSAEMRRRIWEEAVAGWRKKRNS
jgi:hypothetical protein